MILLWCPVCVGDGTCHWRRSAISIAPSRRGGFPTLSPTWPTQSQSCPPGRSGGHHGCQLRIGQRSAQLPPHFFLTCRLILSLLDCDFAIVECARVFHGAGARLVLCGRDAGRLQQVVEELITSTRDKKQQVFIHTHKKTPISHNTGVHK